MTDKQYNLKLDIRECFKRCRRPTQDALAFTMSVRAFRRLVRCVIRQPKRLARKTMFRCDERCGNLRMGRNKQTCVMCFFYRLHASKTIEQLFFTSTRPYKKGDRFQLNGKTYVIL